MKSASYSRNPCVMYTTLESAKKAAPTSNTYGSQCNQISPSWLWMDLWMSSMAPFTQNMFPAIDPAVQPSDTPPNSTTFGLTHQHKLIEEEPGYERNDIDEDTQIHERVLQVLQRVLSIFMVPKEPSHHSARQNENASDDPALGQLLV
eukprot:CAMPEP_0113832990 /NCGR_PEP_ID=MMETSP0328-20130328/7670_1 /TAXON_ID=39455 /ORGANISM="Alexandrium minutum" /LENGTH=147 /DNA_ID=CAMNT_0000801233 /DNA_START=677 /DNA_END=1119 /DNA_ORIENTATION=+ /assembly_acc=CAM_ASM_000350